MSDAAFTAIEKSNLIERVEKLTVDNATASVAVTTLQTWVVGLQKDIKEIKDILINRPTWQITAVLSFLSSTVVALLILLLQVHSGAH